VISEDSANDAPRKRRMPRVVTLLRNANAAPRAIMPNAARVSGMYRVVTTAANAPENAVQSTTSTKMSQTWLASHTGPSECSMRSRRRAPRRVPPASRSQIPAPKSAPPNRA
jgi:hypothetical protein